MQSQRSFFHVLLGLIFLFFVAQRLLFFHPSLVESTMSVILYPFVSAQQRLSSPVVGALQSIEQYHTIAAQYEELKKDYEYLQAQHIQLLAEQHFIQTTSEIMQFAQRYQTDQLLLAHIMLRSSIPDNQFLLVDAGSSAGVQRDMVAVYQNSIIGRVIECYPLYSKVVLLTDPRSHIAAVTATTNAKGIVEGTGNAHSISLNFVNHMDAITIGDLVLTSGQGTIFPQGFALGTIVAAEVQGVQHIITVEPSVNVDDIEYCYLMKKI